MFLRGGWGRFAKKECFPSVIRFLICSMLVGINIAYCLPNGVLVGLSGDLSGEDSGAPALVVASR